ncbi:MAG TPA: outer membrane lipoprotein carrier protein LolA [Paenalcaligenes sp.]|nr:outer membrane lipoprotein carrier protein LolA [Paenalcaligenes sp.]
MQLFKKLMIVSALALGQWALMGTLSAANADSAVSASTVKEQASHQGPASIQLRNFIKGVQKAKGRFTQQTFSPDGQAQPKQDGHFAFNREKGQFLWQVEKPYEQLVLADGQRLIQYDPDLSQATERGIEDTVGSSPAAILFGSRRIDNAFDLQDEDAAALHESADDRFVWLRASPKDDEAGFEHVDMGFEDGLPQQLIITDGFGQRTEILLQDIQPDASLSDDTFKFETPEGVDFIQLQ